MMRVAVGFATRKRQAGAVTCGLAGALLLVAMPLLSPTPGHAQAPPPADKCLNGKLTPKSSTNISTTGAEVGTSQPNLEISGECDVTAVGDYYYAKVNIKKGGVLKFIEPTDNTKPDRVTDFWASSIIIENGGTLQAGEPQNRYGKHDYTLNIILYGKDLTNHDDPKKYPNGDPLNNAAGGDTCITDDSCGVPSTMWADNGTTPYPGCGIDKGYDKVDCLPGLATDKTDYFYRYGPIYGTKTGYYGYKVLGVGYGGSLLLYGYKGTTGASAADNDPTATGTGWMRLASNLAAGDKSLTLLHVVDEDWRPGDKVVVTTTDYLPGHSEELTIATITKEKVTVTTGAQYAHNGTKFPLTNKLSGAGTRLDGMDPDLKTAAETRAAVALLTRSIRIVSGGDFAGDYFDCVYNENAKMWYAPAELSHDQKPIAVKEHCATARASSYSFGAHTVFRQGFRKLQIQGVEFHQMGVGGREGHYPVHFHMARKVPTDTFIKDSSVSESMTRWYVLHSTQGVLLQRNVGWKSIGHGYYIEDGTETDNKFYANLGAYARGAVVSAQQNPRNIPGILAENGSDDKPKYRSDIYYPSIFWITNGWNDFIGNMAAGAGTCGVCYWLHAANNNDMVEYPAGSMSPMKWSGYSALQATGNGGRTPLKTFYKNYCSTAMHSFFTTSNAISDCNGVRVWSQTDADSKTQLISPVESVAPGPLPAGPPAERTRIENIMAHYYPKLGGNRYPTVCESPESCASVKECNNDDPKTCAVTLLDHYTSSFNWAAKNFSSIWLRTPGWFLVDNSFISDVQNGGLTFITGGDYSRSSMPLGYWGLVSHSVFVGETQPGGKYASAAGPPAGTAADEKAGSVVCDTKTRGDACVGFRESVAYPKEDWSVGQRLFNIYDGPAYQDANAYVDIPVSECDTTKPCLYSGVLNATTVPGVRKDSLTGNGGFLPNAAIGWKQPNGFYYPPAFNSSNLYFKNVAIRHYVIEPLFQPGTYLTDDDKVGDQFLNLKGSIGKMTGFTDVDRQTVLNDDDGTLTGFKPTISVNEDGFFGAPVQASQCRSNVGVDSANACNSGKVSPSKTRQPPTARSSPYDYVTTVIYPGCAMDPNIAGGGDKPTDLIAACGSRRDDIDKTKTGQDINVCDNGNCARITLYNKRGGDWSQACSEPFCYGVPIYRQYLTGSKSDKNREWATWYASQCDDSAVDKTTGKVKPGCKFPFTRMNGASEWQRDVLTVNNGKFYIDTTVSLKTQQTSTDLGRPGTVQDQYVECSQRPSGQCQQRSVNVFQGGKQYFVFLLFAKPTTKQTYQIYVGNDFVLNKDSFKGIRITDTNVRFKYVDWDNSADVTSTKPELSTKPLFAQLVSEKDPKTPDPKGGILQVTIDFSKLDKAIVLDPNPASATNTETCKPATFCEWKGSKSCGCKLSKDDPRVIANPKLWGTNGQDGICGKTCKTWAVKALDCPDGGCLGFAFTLPKRSSDKPFADDSYHRPPPEEIDVAKAPWNVRFSAVGTTLAGEGCFYGTPQIPDPTSASQCKVPDCAMGEANAPFCADKLPTATTTSKR